MKFNRSSGIILHPTSLPGKYGIGDFGPEAYKFIDLLKKSGHSLWQIFPLGPTGYGDSPYQCLSAFAGNHLLINPDLLLDDKLIDKEDIKCKFKFQHNETDYEKASEYKSILFAKAYSNFVKQEKFNEEAYLSFCGLNKYWLDDYSLFIALKKGNGLKAWFEWDKDISLHYQDAVNGSLIKYKDEINYEKFIQYLFHKQWSALKNYANINGVKIIGDMPIYVAYDSADVWGDRRYFSVDEKGGLKLIAGVPPDYFSSTGQLWGNPTYNWDVMIYEDFEWWKKRFSKTFQMFDVVRIDHFRGFDEYWAVDGNAETAINGEWLKAPGEALFKEIERAFGNLPIIAEDLGIITKSVEDLRDQFNFPGMKILQFGLGKEGAKFFLPHNFIKNCIAHTGSHDNDTTRGFLDNEKMKKSGITGWAKKYFRCKNEDKLVFEMIHSLYASAADTVVIPMQDILGLGTEARMNLPGTLGGNWKWRFTWDQIPPGFAETYMEMNELFDRANGKAAE